MSRINASCEKKPSKTPVATLYKCLNGTVERCKFFETKPMFCFALFSSCERGIDMPVNQTSCEGSEAPMDGIQESATPGLCRPSISRREA